MEGLAEGYRRFRRAGWREHRERFKALAARGQAPSTLVIACSDSRVDPQMIFDAAPGELFVVRNVANLVPPYAPDADYHGTSAAIEFAVRSLRVAQVVVLGHASCGGIRALLRDGGGEATDFVTAWTRIAAAARERALAAAGGDEETAQRLCEEEAVKVSLANLLTFPWLRARVEHGDLALLGGVFGIETGELRVLDATGEFRPVPAS